MRHFSGFLTSSVFAAGCTTLAAPLVPIISPWLARPLSFPSTNRRSFSRSIGSEDRTSFWISWLARPRMTWSTIISSVYDTGLQPSSLQQHLTENLLTAAKLRTRPANFRTDSPRSCCNDVSLIRFTAMFCFLTAMLRSSSSTVFSSRVPFNPE